MLSTLHPRTIWSPHQPYKVLSLSQFCRGRNWGSGRKRLAQGHLFSKRTRNSKDLLGHWAPLAVGSSSKYTDICTQPHNLDHPYVDVIFSRARWPGICLLPRVHADSVLLVRLPHSSRFIENGFVSEHWGSFRYQKEVLSCSAWIIFKTGFRIFLYIFLKILFIVERWGGRRKGEKHRCARDTRIGCLVALTRPQMGNWSTTKACSLTDLLICRPVLNPLRHTSQG